MKEITAWDIGLWEWDGAVYRVWKLELHWQHGKQRYMHLWLDPDATDDHIRETITSKWEGARVNIQYELPF